MVQLKIQTNFIKLKFSFRESSLSDCLDVNYIQPSGLAIKGTLKYVSNKSNISNKSNVGKVTSKIAIHVRFLLKDKDT